MWLNNALGSQWSVLSSSKCLSPEVGTAAFDTLTLHLLSFTKAQEKPGGAQSTARNQVSPGC